MEALLHHPALILPGKRKKNEDRNNIKTGSYNYKVN
jgi:hypothetical protein